MQALWNTIFYQPIYNIVIFLMNNVTFGDVGFAIILVTVIIKFILYPLTKKSIKSQILMKRMEPEIKLIKKNYVSSHICITSIISQNNLWQQKKKNV